MLVDFASTPKQMSVIRAYSETHQVEKTLLVVL